MTDMIQDPLSNNAHFLFCRFGLVLDSTPPHPSTNSSLNFEHPVIVMADSLK